MANQWTEYVKAAQTAGCPRDQIERFISFGVVLGTKQLSASAAARACDHPDGPTEVGYGGARGGGKSHWGIVQLAIDDCQRQPGLKCLVLRKVGKANKENFEDLRSRILYGIKHHYDRQHNILTFPNNSRIILGHFQNESDIDAYLGLEYDVILVEEATTLSNAKYKSIRTCLRTSKKTWRPRMYTTTNPGGIGHAWYKDLFIMPMRTNKAKNTIFIQATVRDNKYVNKEYIQQLEALSGWQKRAWLDGDWDIAAGQFFTNFRGDVHVISPFEIDVSGRFVLSLDAGFTHFTAAHLHYVLGEEIYTIDEYGQRKKTPQTNAQGILAMLERHGLTPRDMWKQVSGQDLFAKKVVDGNKQRATNDIYKEYGFRFKPAEVDRISGASHMLSLLGDVEEANKYPEYSEMWITHWPKWFIVDRCVRLIEQIPSMVHDPSRPEDVDKVDCDEDGYGGDDFYDSARMGLMAVRRKRKIWQAS